MSDESNGVLRDAAADELCSRIIAHLAGGGLINPEMANHDAVRDLLIDARAEVLRLRAAATLSEAEDDAMGEAIRMGDRWGWSETLRGLRERLRGGR